jgi:hypothetical protein
VYIRKYTYNKIDLIYKYTLKYIQVNSSLIWITSSFLETRNKNPTGRNRERGRNVKRKGWRNREKQGGETTQY